MNETNDIPEAIAVIGMSGRFPHAGNPDEFWQNLISGKDCVSRFGSRTDADGTKYVGARSLIDNPDLFDASFFGIYPKEAELMDPQHRFFLECAWEAIEHAGYDPEAYPGMIGVYAGLSLNTYLLNNLGMGRELAKNYQVAEYQTMLGNDKDFLPVRVSYKLNLRGPSMAIQTACSTSLVAICQAATSLLTYQCDMALAGGVSISFPQKRDYRFTEEGMVSPDGTCRAFDADAAGTVFGHGCGVVLLKRLSEAVADRDPILAVIKGWAVNNDGSDKIGFAAPGLNAQADVIAMAQASAGVHPSEVSYIEAHGTGTPMGDPIEVAALTTAFRDGGAEANSFCKIGTGKTHIGHLDVAAGVTGLIKTIQQFRHGKIPALLHYKTPNPKIDFANSPFEPVASAMDWKSGDSPRIAGVSAFGVGGTNAHVVMEEAPAPLPTSPSAKNQLLALSAKSESALADMSERLAAHLEAENPDIADVAYTLTNGRRAFNFRHAIVAEDITSAISSLRKEFKVGVASSKSPRVAFLFPGQGSQSVGMGRGLYDSEPIFRAAVDECAEISRPWMDRDLRSVIFPSPHEEAMAHEAIHQTSFTQPCLFAIEYASAKLWISQGVQPTLLIGHSVGEYVAAVIAGTFTLHDALRLLVTRAQMMQALPEGAMLAVRAAANDLELTDGISLAAVNSPGSCTISGTHVAVSAYQNLLESREIPCRLLPTSHAFHSAMMEPMLENFTATARQYKAAAPQIPWISTRTGRYLDADTLADASYWAGQIRETVHFSDAIETAFAEENILFLEVGPGKALSQFARQHPKRDKNAVISSMPEPSESIRDHLSAIGELWKTGAIPNTAFLYQNQDRARLHLPTYPFERQSYWIDRSDEPAAISQTQSPPAPLPSPVVMNVNRLADFQTRLRAIVKELSGMTVEDDSASFTELGFDSLFLTQASQAIQSRFGVKVTFRQMLGDLSSVTNLAKHLDATLPAESTVVAPSPQPAQGSNGTLEEMMSHQIQLMQSLLGQQPSPTVEKSDIVRWPVNHERKAHTNTRFGPFKPLEKGENGKLTASQQKALDEWISRYVRKTGSSKAYTAEHRSHYADPRAVSGFKSLWKEMVYPIVSARTKGSKIWDIDGNEYVDITMGFGTYFFGHSPDWLMEAVEKQLQNGIEIGPQSPIAGKLAKAICELTNMERATFCNTGSEAVMAAMRLARTITGRSRIAYFTGDYHGMFDEVLVRGSWVDGIYKAQPIAPGIPESLVENMLVLDYADPASIDILKAHAHELAAVMIEPVQSRAPGLQPREFMQEVREITRQSGTALIFDEVVTGFRCAPGGAQAYFGVEADLATYGKVIGGGMPIGVLAGKREYMDALDGGAWNYGDDSFPGVGVTFFAGTFVRHPLALAAAWRVVEHLKGEGPRLQIDMEERVARLCRTLNVHFEKCGAPIRLPHFSAYAVIEHAPELKYASLLWYLLREKGIHVWEGRPLYFTTAHSDEDLDRVVLTFVDVVAEMQTAGFLPGNTNNKPDGFPRYDSAPTTEAQREIFHAVLMGEEANCAFNESNVIRLTGTLDHDALKTAIHDIIVRHPALRSTFSEDGSTQHFHPSASSTEILEHDFSDMHGDSPAARLPMALVNSAESSMPFDLHKGPLVRFHLVRLGQNHHELVFTAHHIVCDGWSFGMILAELATAYNARKANRLPMLPPAMSFADYARQEKQTSHSEERNHAENFWISKFSNGTPVLELPTDHPRPQMKSYQGAMESITLDAERYQRLKQAAPKLGGTLFSTLLAGFATLLHRITGQDDLVIGVPAAGQTRIGRDELVGHCLNFLPLRLQPRGDVTFRDFSTEVRDHVLEAYDHQDYTFGTLLKKIQFPRDTSRVPLVSVIFNVDKSGIDQLHFDGLEINVETNPKQFVNFDLFFNLVQTNERMVVECEYNTDLHDPSTIRSWLGAYEALIESVISNAESSIKDLEMIADTDRETLLHDWNNTSASLPDAPSLHHFFEAQVDLQPDAIALWTAESKLTYSQLDGHANALAAKLRENGVTRETLVGICAERRAETLVAILAVLKAGGAYVTIDPKYPTERITYILKDAKAPILLTQRNLANHAGESRTIFIDDALSSIAGRLKTINRPEDLAYVIYTSGSTGQPKGVAIEHRNAIALIGWAQTVYQREDLAGVLFSTSICFDLSTFEIFVTLASGGSIILAENALDLRDHPHRERISLINTVPSAISELIDAELVPNNVKIINLAGEALATSLVDRIYASTRVEKVYDLYGPSEDTTYSTYALRKAGMPATIGKPISNTRAYVLDPCGRLLPRGVPGELYLAGAGLARGYLHRPELTAEKFVPDPFDPTSGSRLYRTGDRVRHFENGDLQFLGRLDHQVKIRGHRIELGEIETALESHPAVEQAIVHVHNGRLIGYLRPPNGRDAADGTGIWQDQWDLLYQSAIDQTGTSKLDRMDSVIAGWSDVDNVEAQVTEWIDTTVERIRNYDGRRIFEIGCGTGQLLARLACDAECYWAADISKVAVEALEKNQSQPHVRLFHRPADDFSDLPEAGFDTVIINSVAQYFPDSEYLKRVIRGATKLLQPGGRIFLGDIQSKALLPVYHSEAQRDHSTNINGAGALREKVRQRLARETELSLDPAWFQLLALPEHSHVETRLRRGNLVNETTAYHYDVIIHIGSVPATCELPTPLPWKNLNLEQLEAVLAEQPRSLHITDIPDARLASALGFHRSLESLPPDAPIPPVPTPASNAASAEDLHAIATLAGYHVHVRWLGDGTSGLLEAAFIPLTEKSLPLWNDDLPTKAAAEYANSPYSATTGQADLMNRMRRHLTPRLPEYMIPSQFVILDDFPLTPNGKVNRKALPIPADDEGQPTNRATIGPRDKREEQLVEIWKQVLGKSNIGIEDDIFELGGDSILIFQITTRATRAGIELTPKQVFRLRTIAAISTEMVIANIAAKPAVSTIQRVNRDAYRRKI